MLAKKTAYIVEHDFIMVTDLADRVIVFEGQPSVDTVACKPQSLLEGMNHFLKMFDITFRRYQNTCRINKLDSFEECDLKNTGHSSLLDV